MAVVVVVVIVVVLVVLVVLVVVPAMTLLLDGEVEHPYRSLSKDIKTAT